MSFEQQVHFVPSQFVTSEDISAMQGSAEGWLDGQLSQFLLAYVRLLPGRILTFRSCVASHLGDLGQSLDPLPVTGSAAEKDDCSAGDKAGSQAERNAGDGRKRVAGDILSLVQCWDLSHQERPVWTGQVRTNVDITTFAHARMRSQSARRLVGLYVRHDSTNVFLTSVTPERAQTMGDQQHGQPVRSTGSVDVKHRVDQRWQPSKIRGKLEQQQLFLVTYQPAQMQNHQKMQGPSQSFQEVTRVFTQLFGQGLMTSQ
jgi:hypothetical protein